TLCFFQAEAGIRDKLVTGVRTCALPISLHSLFAAGAIIGGGSDHMQKIGALRAINPYHPFLAMWVATTRRAQGVPEPLHREESRSEERRVGKECTSRSSPNS